MSLIAYFPISSVAPFQYLRVLGAWYLLAAAECRVWPEIGLQSLNWNSLHLYTRSADRIIALNKQYILIQIILNSLHSWNFIKCLKITNISVQQNWHLQITAQLYLLHNCSICSDIDRIKFCDVIFQRITAIKFKMAAQEGSSSACIQPGGFLRWGQWHEVHKYILRTCVPCWYWKILNWVVVLCSTDTGPSAHLVHADQVGLHLEWAVGGSYRTGYNYNVWTGSVRWRKGMVPVSLPPVLLFWGICGWLR